MRESWHSAPARYHSELYAALDKCHPHNRFFPRHVKVKPHKPVRRSTNNKIVKQPNRLNEQKIVRTTNDRHCIGQLRQSKANKPYTAMTNSL